MPVMEGWEVIDKLRADGRLGKMNVLIITSAENGVPCDLQVFQKPLNLEKLISGVGAVC
jgi:CheY-like chemotaxis protein